MKMNHKQFSSHALGLHATLPRAACLAGPTPLQLFARQRRRRRDADGGGSVSLPLPYKVLPTEAASACEIVRRLRRRRRWRQREVGRTWDGGRRGLSPSFKCLGRPSLPRPPLPSHLQGSAKRRASGLVNCVPALTYHSCLACSIHVIPPLAEPCGRRSFE